VGAAEGRPRQAVSTEESGIDEFDLSPDSKRVAFILHGEVFLDRSGDPDIFYYDLAAQAERRLTDSPQRDLFPVVSPDGRWCAYYRSIREIRLVDLRDGSDSLLAEGFFLKDTAYDYGSLSWSPDSEWIAFVDTDELDFRNVKVVNVHAREARQISFLPNVTAFYIHWAPDGSFIVFTSGSFTRYRRLFRVDLTESPVPTEDAKPNVEVELDGIKGRLHQLVTHGDKAYGLGLTPDGKHVVTYMSAFGEANIYAIPTDPSARGPLEKLTPSSYISQMRAGGDDQSFWYLSRGTIGARSTASPTPAEVRWPGRFRQSWRSIFIAKSCRSSPRPGASSSTAGRRRISTVWTGGRSMTATCLTPGAPKPTKTSPRSSRS
jgi:hypothetical protein